jgi:Rieske 2Fe-2S family protein
MTSTVDKGLAGTDYCSPEVYALEREVIFFNQWFYVGRANRLSAAGSWITADVVGESILITRGKDAQLRAFYNVCRHRGARLCEEPSGSTRSSIRCPYHAWGYGLDGKLISTPNVERGEVDEIGLWPVHVAEWEGFLFVNLDRDTPEPLSDALGAQSDNPLPLARYGLQALETAKVVTWDVEANWKILIENFNECLHCPTVHPELVTLVPAYRKGAIIEDDRDDGAVVLVEGSGIGGPESEIPRLPGVPEEDAMLYYAKTVFPNLLLDVSATEAIATAIFPTGPMTSRVVAEYLFDPSVINDETLDVTPNVDFNVLVQEQDNAVCERVQRGVRSRAFDHALLPAKDSLVHDFAQRYLHDRGLGLAQNG